jgi:hypothetical protein
LKVKWRGNTRLEPTSADFEATGFYLRPETVTGGGDSWVGEFFMSAPGYGGPIRQSGSFSEDAGLEGRLVGTDADLEHACTSKKDGGGGGLRSLPLLWYRSFVLAAG